jgi:hypothetical protein
VFQAFGIGRPAPAQLFLGCVRERHCGSPTRGCQLVAIVQLTLNPGLRTNRANKQHQEGDNRHLRPPR